MSTYQERVAAALSELRAGKMIILVDDADRENEGDLICAAEKITPALMNFMIRQGSGIVCLALTKEKADSLGLKLMVSPQENTSQRGTPFAVSIEARENVKTGVSAADRTVTIQTVMRPDAAAADLCSPGHVFPLIAAAEGVFARAGHTEGSVDLMRLAGLQPAAALCEVMNSDGSMAAGETLKKFAATHQLTCLAMRDLVDYRLATENLIAEEIAATLPTEKYGVFQMTVMKEKITGNEHVILTKAGIASAGTAAAPLLLRIHSACMTGDMLGSRRCDCQQQLHYGLQKISETGGMLIYLAQEGRGIGLFAKIRAYALQEKNGLDTVEANQHLDLPADARSYAVVASILRQRGVTHVRLLTHNPEKINDLEKYGLIVTREEMPVFAHADNRHYLATKKKRMMHLLNSMALED